MKANSEAVLGTRVTDEVDSAGFDRRHFSANPTLRPLRVGRDRPEVLAAPGAEVDFHRTAIGADQYHGGSGMGKFPMRPDDTKSVLMGWLDMRSVLRTTRQHHL